MNTVHFSSIIENDHLGDNNLHLFENYTRHRKQEPAKYIFSVSWLDDEMDTCLRSLNKCQYVILDTHQYLHSDSWCDDNIIEKTLPNRKIAEQKIAEIEKSDGETKCIICMVKKCDTMLHPCTHANFCSGCFANMKESGRKNCPFCNESIECIITIER